MGMNVWRVCTLTSRNQNNASFDKQEHMERMFILTIRNQKDDDNEWELQYAHVWMELQGACILKSNNEIKAFE
jgi:hypothetical protein